MVRVVAWPRRSAGGADELTERLYIDLGRVFSARCRRSTAPSAAERRHQAEVAFRLAEI